MSDKIPGIGRPPKRNAKLEAMRKANDERKQQYFFSGKAAKESDNVTNKNDKPAENLPAVVTTGFQLAATNQPSLTLSPEVLAMLDESDRQGYEETRDTLPIASIRQKPLVDDRGKTTLDAGGFKMYDKVSKANSIQIADVAGDTGLTVTILLDKTSRSRWLKDDFTKPLCRSNDGVTGEGDPGGRCATCPMSKWTDGKRPECGENRDLLVWDWSINAFYMLRLGRSGLTPYNLFRALLDRGQGCVPHAFKVRVVTVYKTEPLPHYVPVFEILAEQVPIDMFKQFKEMRRTMVDVFKKTSEVATADEEHLNGNGHSGFQTSDSGGDVPPGVTPVKESDDEEDLPF